MPIHPAHKDKQATADALAAILLLTWATLRPTRQIDPDEILPEWEKIKEKIQ